MISNEDQLKSHGNLKNIISTHIPTSFQRVYCFDEEEADLNELADQIFAETGLKVKADFEGDIVNGYLASQVITPSKDMLCSWCLDTALAGKRHQCVILNLYDVDEDPIEDNPKEIHKKGHKSIIRKAGNISNSKFNKLVGVFDNHKTIAKTRRSAKMKGGI